ncbi:hypothetical protein CRM71_01865 [Prevotella jejuni]|uniref:Dynamin family protein n=1 Tax=Prevotella jejuni TaxID=1177574 RepID=A0A2K9H905_9BACT|nr:dynamin family protein [Prevotella jejuni]AUI54197.1 hypothetical protein CRM71_01865 [Prevotella jejuni]SNS08534.1 Dynamin family protein [Prevotella jejuni]
MKKNQFQEYCEQVKKKLQEYKDVRQQANINDEGLNAAVERKAKPFVEGHFTLAVVGKMSAGKSTFINAFLGKNILPTGHFQTTAILTKIEHAEKESIKIIYGDDQERTFSDGIEGQLKQYVAIKEKYNDLPLNYINEKIIIGWDKKEICSPDVIKDMEAISREKVDRNLLEEYIKEHPKSKIAKEVTVRCPFPEDCIGWRIVDTPGVGAIGGFDLETTKFLTAKLKNGGNNVDAIIFLHKGNGNIEDKDTNDFVKNTFNNLSDDVKKRVFFVITHTASDDYRDNKDAYMRRAKSLFKDRYGIKEDRLLEIDSLMEILIRYINQENKDAQSLLESKTVPDSSWNEEVWKKCRTLLRGIKYSLKDDGINVNNESILERAQEWSGFNKFRKILNKFVKTEKTNAFEDFLDTIDEDIEEAIKGKENDKRNLQDGAEKIKKQIEKLEYVKLNIQEELGKIRQEFSQDNVSKRFDFVEERIQEHIIDANADYANIRREATNLYDLADKAKSALFRKMQSIIEEYVKVCKSEVFFKKPDFDKIEAEATDQAKYPTDIIGKRKVPGFCCDDYETYIEHKGGDVNAQKKLQSFRTMSVRHIRQEANDFKTKIQKEVESYISKVNAAQQKKIDEQKRHLEELKAKHKVSSPSELRDMIKATENDINKLKGFKSSLKEN